LISRKPVYRHGAQGPGAHRVHMKLLRALAPWKGRAFLRAWLTRTRSLLETHDEPLVNWLALLILLALVFIG
jgi:hypothetical protein